MPQPLSKMPQIKNTAFGVDGCIARPKHMLEAMRIIAAAAFADHWLGNVLVGLSPEKGVRLARHFISLEGDSKKAAGFEGTATALLEPDMHELLHLIVKVYRSALKARHPFAHHRYGWTSDDEDIILLIDPRHELIERATRAELMAQRPGGGAMPPEWFAAHDKAKADFTKTIMCYRLAELEAIRKSIEEATQLLTQFWQLTAKKPPPHIHADILAQLTQRLHEKAK